MVAGVPVGLPVFFLPLVVNSYLLVVLLLPQLGRSWPGRLGRVGTERFRRLLAALAVVLVVDLVLDPAAVALGFWAYDGGGIYYGVPLSNFAGWLLSGAIAVSLVDRAFDRDALAARLRECEFALDDFVSFVVLWGATNLYFGNWAAVALALALSAGLVRTDRFDVAVFGRERPERS
jgi:putative membrane protein